MHCEYKEFHYRHIMKETSILPLLVQHWHSSGTSLPSDMKAMCFFETSEPDNPLMAGYVF